MDTIRAFFPKIKAFSFDFQKRAGKASFKATHLSIKFHFNVLYKNVKFLDTLTNKSAAGKLKVAPKKPMNQ